MEQFEKVCEGLEFCIRNPRGVCAKECPYKILCFYTEGETIKNRLMSDALSLIRQQQERIAELEADRTARVMTLEEVKEIGRFEFDNTDRSKETVVWFEKRNGNAFNGGLAPSRIEYCYHPEYGDDEYCDSVTQYVSGSVVTSRLHCGVYGKKWRCWTQRPTDEQREKVKWDD